MKKIAVPFLSAVAGGLISLSVFNYFFSPQPVKYTITQSDNQVRHATLLEDPMLTPTDFTMAADRTLNSVVHIKTVAQAKKSTRYNDPWFDFFFGSPGNGYGMPSQGAGSGVIMSAEGYIITNNHVIANASSIEVTLNDKRTYKAKVIGTDPNTDIAVIKIDETGLPAVTFGNSDNLKVGQWVLAIGNPFNLTSTATAGIVSAKGRNIDIIQENYKIESFIQTDAAVNPGNSGGALVNINGDLVGINTAIQTHTGSFEGYSFAVPSNLVKKIAEDLIEYGKVQRGLLGVNISDINAQFAAEKGINRLEGVYVDGVLEGSAAQDAGLKEGDIILGINGVNINSVSGLQEQVGLYRPGDKLRLQIRRNGIEREAIVTLKNQSGTTKVVDSATEVKELLGAKFESPSAAELKKLGLGNGLKVTEVSGGKLQAIGIKPGFIITEVNGKKINSVEELESALAAGGKGNFYLGGSYPTGEKVYYSFNY